LFSRRALSFGFVACLSAGVVLQSGGADLDPSSNATIQQLMRLNTEIETAVVKGDIAFLERVLAADFRFPHGDAWTAGGRTANVDNKRSWLAAAREGFFVSREVSAQEVELHGDVALTTGRIRVRSRSNDPRARDYSIRFLRVYAQREGRWQLLSHRTVRQTSGPD